MSGIEFLPLVAVALLFWLFVIRPQSRRQRELAGMQDSLSVGDTVVLTSGIFGSVTRVEDDRAGVEIAPGVTITVAKGAIGIVNPPAPGPSLDKTDPLDQPDRLENDHGTDGAAPEEKY